MEKEYVDEWGYVVTRKEISDWSDWDTWSRWERQFNWELVEDEPQEQDIVAYRDDVISWKKKRTKSIFEGERLIIGRVCKIVRPDVYFEVICSDGKEPLEQYKKIMTTLGRMNKYGCYRWPRKKVVSENKQGHEVSDIERRRTKLLGFREEAQLMCPALPHGAIGTFPRPSGYSH